MTPQEALAEALDKTFLSQGVSRRQLAEATLAALPAPWRLTDDEPPDWAFATIEVTREAQPAREVYVPGYPGSIEGEPATQAGRALLDDITPHVTNAIAEMEPSFLYRILAIEAEAVAPWRAALQEVVDQYDDYGGVSIGVSNALGHARALLGDGK